MKSDKALSGLKKAIYTPVVLAVLMLLLDFIGQANESFPDFNRLFSIMSPMQTIGGLALIFGMTTIGSFHSYLKVLKQENLEPIK